MGEDVSDFERDELARLRREAFGFVFQSYNLIGTVSALANVEVPAVYSGTPPAARDARAKELLDSLGLGERLQHRPSQLSGGQQQRVSIARALMNGGRIVLADEPTGALDKQERRRGDDPVGRPIKPRTHGHPYHARAGNCRSGQANHPNQRWKDRQRFRTQVACGYDDAGNRAAEE